MPVYSKNKKPMTALERRHVTRVKLLPCGLCGAGGGDLAPSEAHEIKQGQWMTAIPLCEDCHRGSFNGLGGQKRMWQVMKKDELDVLGETVGRLLYG